MENMGLKLTIHFLLWLSLNWSMQHAFGAHTLKFRLTKLRKFRGRKPAGLTADSETQLVASQSAKCLSLSGHLLRPVE